jgi:hypothetical protein
MKWDNVLGLALIMGLFGLLILIPLWPGVRQGRRLLNRWGVTEPSEPEVGEAVTYLRRRRLWYPWLFLGVSGLVDAVGMRTSNSDLGWSLLAVLMLGALIAELLAQRPRRGPVHSASLTPRRPTDLVPAWALVLHLVLLVVAVVLHVGSLAGVGWASTFTATADTRTQWAALIASVGSSVLVWLVLALTVRRPAMPEARVDLALRVRSGRVVVGLGVAALVLLLDTPTTWWSWAIVVLGLSMWNVIASPSGLRTPKAPVR